MSARLENSLPHMPLAFESSSACSLGKPDSIQPAPIDQHQSVTHRAAASSPRCTEEATERLVRTGSRRDCSAYNVHTEEQILCQSMSASTYRGRDVCMVWPITRWSSIRALPGNMRQHSRNGNVTPYGYRLLHVRPSGQDT